MAIEIIGAVLAADKTSLNAADVSVLFVLAWHAHIDTWKCWPGNDLLVQETGLTERGVQKALAHLEDEKRIEIEYQTSPRRRVIEVLGEHSSVNSVRGKGEHSSPQGEHSSCQGELCSCQGEHSSPEPVSNQEENQSLNPSMNLRALRAPKEPSLQKPSNLQGVVNYFTANLRARALEEEIPLPGGLNQRNFAQALGRVKTQCDLDIDGLVAMVDEYLARPGLWAKDKHPGWDFVSANTVARLRNRLAAKSVDDDRPTKAALDLNDPDTWPSSYIYNARFDPELKPIYDAYKAAGGKR